MSDEKPAATTLLALARGKLTEELAPLLPDAYRGEIALIARTMAIAERTLATGDAPQESAALLGAFYGEAPTAEQWRRLAAEIRAGLFDAPGARREQLRRLLLAATEERLRISNPEFLAPDQTS